MLYNIMIDHLNIEKRKPCSLLQNNELKRTQPKQTY